MCRAAVKALQRGTRVASRCLAQPSQDGLATRLVHKDQGDAASKVIDLPSDTGMLCCQALAFSNSFMSDSLAMRSSHEIEKVLRMLHWPCQLQTAS